ncbi:MAG: hypothetical protein FWG61_04865, partial [Firmicutes bacterium]|nr:hypothetical protein [Bacillota bacterium]
IYEANGRVAAIKDAYGNYKRFEYDPKDRVIAETDENGVRRTFDYDAAGNLLAYTDGLGNKELYSYDANGNMIKLTDRNGNATTYVYDLLNRVTEETDPLGKTNCFTYDKDSRITAVKDKNGNSTRYILDGNGNIIESIDATGHSSYFTYDSMNRLITANLRRIDTKNKIDETQETLFSYDHRGLCVKEVNALGNGKIRVYDGNGNLLQETDEDGFTTLYEYNKTNLVNKINYADGKKAAFLYNGTGELIEFSDWNGKTSLSRDLLNRIMIVNDHNKRKVVYGYDNAGNTTSIGYPDGTQADYYYDAENHIVQMVDVEDGVFRFNYDPNGNIKYKEYPNFETAYYFYDQVNQLLEMDEYVQGGKKLYKTTYSWDAVGNLLSERKYNHNQSNSSNNGNNTGNTASVKPTVSTAQNGNNVTITIKDGTTVLATQVVQFAKNTTQTYNVNDYTVQIEYNGSGVKSASVSSIASTTPGASVTSKPTVTTAQSGNNVTITIKDGTTVLATQVVQFAKNTTQTYNVNGYTVQIEYNGSGVKSASINSIASTTSTTSTASTMPPSMTVWEDGTIINPGGNIPPGLNKKKLPAKDINKDNPTTPANPGQEDGSDAKASKGDSIFSYDKLNRMISSVDGNNGQSNYVYDTLGNLLTETNKNKVIDYRYNAMNQLIYKGTNNDNITFSYDKRGNLTRKDTKNKVETFEFDATNHLVKGINEKGDTSQYTYNALFMRINNTQVAHNGKAYARDFIIDYNSPHKNELMVMANGEYEQSHVYHNNERLLQVTNKANGLERLLYVHEDIRGTATFYSKSGGQVFEELTYDAWGKPQSPGKLLNNDHGTYISANFTGHNFDVIIGMYFAQARFYDAENRAFISRDPVLSELNWYKYAANNPQTYIDKDGECATAIFIAIGIGIAVGVGAQAVSDIISGQFSGWEAYLGAAVGGAIGGALSVVLPGIGSVFSNTILQGAIIGAASAAANTAVTGFLKGDLSWEQIAKAAVIGGITGAVSAGVSSKLSNMLGVENMANSVAKSAVNIAISTVSGFVAGTVTTFTATFIETGDIGLALKAATNPNNMLKTLTISFVISAGVEGIRVVRERYVAETEKFLEKVEDEITAIADGETLDIPLGDDAKISIGKNGVDIDYPLGDNGNANINIKDSIKGTINIKITNNITAYIETKFTFLHWPPVPQFDSFGIGIRGKF